MISVKKRCTLVSSTETGSDTEIAADLYGPVKVSELDYDSFQDRMTAEEWAGLQLWRCRCQ